MKTKALTSVALAAALLATAGCGSKRPPAGMLPPAAAARIRPGRRRLSKRAAGVAVPGSRADFIQNVPSDRVFFALDSFSLTQEARSILDAQAQWLNGNPQCASPSKAMPTNAAPANTTSRWASGAPIRPVYLESRGVSAGRLQTSASARSGRGLRQ
jgi:outer membrane protein OmpA-like peptidoglycan-associated protein